MFKPKTPRILSLSQVLAHRIQQLEGIFSGTTKVYIDYANVRPWSEKLGWHVDLKRLKQLLDSFDTISEIRIYNGTLIGDAKGEELNSEIESFGYTLVTKPVKIMKKSIDVSSVPATSDYILRSFVRMPLLRQFKIETIEYLNQQLRALNRQGMYDLEDRKCNFDVEIGRDMLLDFEKNEAESFILWSGDSDFADPIEQLLRDKKRVCLFATSGRVASELNALKEKGLEIYDIQKIREFICWKREMTVKVNG